VAYGGVNDSKRIGFHVARTFVSLVSHPFMQRWDLPGRIMRCFAGALGSLSEAEGLKLPLPLYPIHPRFCQHFRL
jgi:hypothetical protein